MGNMINVLWLASWYPGRNDPFDGDFIERHAMAVSRFANITLLYVAKDETLKTNSTEIEKTVNGNLTVYKAYYGRSGCKGMTEQYYSFRKYRQLQKKLYHRIATETGQPALVHVQVAMKAGLLALWLKRKYHIPFVVTEHWSGYYPKILPNIYTGNLLTKWLNKKIIRQATKFLPVSGNLGKMVNTHLTGVQFEVVPNVVNTSLFYYKPAIINKFLFIHPSSMIAIKNAEGILQACKIVKESGYGFQLLMIGGKPARLAELCGQYDLSGHVLFEAAVPYAEVARQMQQSSALLLFSRFENLPCVILEALCCGLPVVSSRVGGIPEVIDASNGILVKSGDVKALADAMMQMIDNYAAYKRPAIAQKATDLYNYDVVGKQYAKVYENILAAGSGETK